VKVNDHGRRDHFDPSAPSIPFRTREAGNKETRAKTLFLSFLCDFLNFKKKFAQTAFMCDNIYTSLAEVSVRPQASSEDWVFLFYGVDFLIR
jgi:hypothetical protein